MKRERSSNDADETRAQILAHVDCYGLTTTTAVAHAVLRSDRKHAETVLERMRHDGDLFHHGACYTRDARRPPPRRLWHDLAVLSYCCAGNRLRPRLSRDDLSGALDPFAQLLGQRSVRDTPCIFDRDGRLARIWVEPFARDDAGPPLGDVLAALQRAMRAQGFGVWTCAAVGGKFRLLVLCRNRSRADEMARWLGRVPLVAPLDPDAIEVPVRTAAMQ